MFDAIIVGAGAIGMMTAQLLSQQGQKVCLLDKGRVGAESSWAGGGILSPLYPWRYSTEVNNLAQWSQQHYLNFLNELTSNTGINSECLQSGLLIRINKEHKPSVESWLARYAVDARFVSAIEVQDIEVLANNSEAESLWLPHITQIRNPRFVRALHQAMQNSKITVHENCEVLAVSKQNKQFSAVRTSTGDIKANNLIIASGAWSSQLLNKIGLGQRSVKIEPVRGQMMVIKTPVNTLKRIILDDEHYLIPRKDGRVLIGSTLEYVGFDKNTTDHAHNELLKAAHAIAPALAHYPVEHHWAGLRPGTSDGIPYIGKHPGLSGVFINSGHFRNGLVLGLASAQLMTNIVLEQPPILETSDYAVSESIEFVE